MESCVNSKHLHEIVHEHLHSAGTSKDSDICNSFQKFLTASHNQGDQRGGL